jgi:hypothetical protein
MSDYAISHKLPVPSSPLPPPRPIRPAALPKPVFEPPNEPVFELHRRRRRMRRLVLLPLLFVLALVCGGAGFITGFRVGNEAPRGATWSFE